MDSKWGGVIVATLAGLGVWLSTRPKTLVKEAVKRPTMDDVGKLALKKEEREKEIRENNQYLYL